MFAICSILTVSMFPFTQQMLIKTERIVLLQREHKIQGGEQKLC